jgi:hypothetical protein
VAIQINITKKENNAIFYNKEGHKETFLNYLCNINVANMGNDKKPLLGMTLAEIKSSVTEIGMPAFTAKQIADWIYCKRVQSISEMTNI